MKGQPREVTQDHLRRRAVVYIRQSSEGQVRDNLGSTEYQRGQVERAVEWGWERERIEVIDDDLGVTGAAADHRRGYNGILVDIAAEEVGAVFVSEVSRISRDSKEQIAFLSLCRIYGVLVVEDGRIHDPSDTTDRFALAVRGLTAELENDTIRKRMKAGVEGCLAKGLTVSPPIIGFVGTKAAWKLDPDTRVQSAIRSVFDAIWQTRSLNGAVRELRRIGIRIPALGHDGAVRWSEATSSSVRRIAKNQKYAGDYVYRNRISDEKCGRDYRGQIKTRKAKAGERFLMTAHHSGYVSIERWNEIQELIRLNTPSKTSRSPGNGSALLQGLMRCEKHSLRAMATGYKAARADGTCLHYYHCNGDLRVGGPQCGNLPGRLLDEAVIGAALDRLAPSSLRAIRAGWEEFLRRSVGEGVAAETALHQARERANNLERRFMEVDPSHRSVAAALEEKWEEARREVEKMTAEAGRRRSQRDEPRDDLLADLEALCADVSGVFWAATTTNRDRKELLRRMISRVIVEKRDQASITMRIDWSDESTPTSVIARLAWGARPTILEMSAAGASYDAIATQLNEMGLRTMQGRSWSRDAVGAAVRARRSRAEEPVLMDGRDTSVIL